ncbi:MAG: prepilin-type N-terminal cleavage/methylation domain-containing protein [Puniceicoccales bacterium]
MHKRPLPRCPIWNSKAASGFTLTEVLVVIAIIAIIAAILIPAVGAVRDKVSLGKSFSNIRQLHSANALYANEHSGLYVPIVARDSEGKLTRWLENVEYRDYLGILEDGSWPQDLLSPNADVLDSNGDRRADRSYAMNITGFTGYSNPNNLWQIRAHAVTDPSKTIAMTDALDWIVSFHGANKYEGEEVTMNSAVAYRYNDLATVLYYDGHVEALSMDELTSDIRQWTLPQ